MKKLLSIMLVVLMALSLFACTGTKPAEPEKPAETPTEFAATIHSGDAPMLIAAVF